MKWWKYEDGCCKEFDSAAEALSVSENRRILSFVGAGGKTTMIYCLAEELKEKGYRVLVTTTTHMEKPKAHFLEWTSLTEGRETIPELLGRYPVLTVGVSDAGNKIKGIPQNGYGLLKGAADFLLVEADGSAKHPVKVPDSHEPVIFPGTEQVVGLLSAGSVGKKIAEAGHRPEKLAAFLGKTADAVIAAEDLIKISTSRQGLLKQVCVPYTIIWTNYEL